MAGKRTKWNMPIKKISLAFNIYHRWADHYKIINHGRSSKGNNPGIGL